MLKRRNYPDENLCQFEGRYWEPYVISEFENYKGNVVPRIDFSIDCLCNEFSPKAKTPVNLFALKATALAIQAKLEKGCKIFVRCIYKPKVTWTKPGKGIQQPLEIVPAFEVKKFVVLAYKSDSMEIVQEDLAETFMARDEAEV